MRCRMRSPLSLHLIDLDECMPMRSSGATTTVKDSVDELSSAFFAVLTFDNVDGYVTMRISESTSVEDVDELSNVFAALTLDNVDGCMTTSSRATFDEGDGCATIIMSSEAITTTMDIDELSNAFAL